MSQKTKQTLCKKFVGGAGDELFGTVQQLVSLRTLPCQCVYPTKQPCPRMSESGVCPFGFCAMHLNTTKGEELATLWNKTLEDLEISETTDEDATNEESGEDVESSNEDVESSESSNEVESSEEAEESDEPVEQPPVVVKKSRKTSAPPAPVAQPTSRSNKKVVAPAPQKKSEPNIKIIKHPRKSRQPASEESSIAEGSGKTKYVPTHDEEEESPAPLPPLTFEKSKFGNYVNKEYSFVLRPRDQVVLGTENKTGGVIKLTPKQIQICKERNVNYLE